MASKYVIQVNEDNLDLIQILNAGIRPLTQDDTTCFIFEVDPTSGAKNQDIVFENDLYDENGNSIDIDLLWLIG
jgi:hypothetical protein